MTTAFHAASAAAIAFSISGHNIEVTAMAAFLGAFPDLSRFLLREKDYSGSYATLHHPIRKFSYTWKAYLIIVLQVILWPLGLHTFLDSMVHNDETGDWLITAYVIEVLFWLIVLIIIGSVLYIKYFN